TVDVDHVDAEPLKRITARILHRFRSPVEAVPLAAGTTQRAELDIERELVAPENLQSLAYEHLVVPHAIEIARVDQGDAALCRHRQCGKALAAIGGAVDIRHTHAAETETRNRRAIGPKFNQFHHHTPSQIFLSYGGGRGSDDDLADIDVCRLLDRE